MKEFLQWILGLAFILLIGVLFLPLFYICVLAMLVVLTPLLFGTYLFEERKDNKSRTLMVGIKSMRYKYLNISCRVNTALISMPNGNIERGDLIGVVKSERRSILNFEKGGPFEKKRSR